MIRRTFLLLLLPCLLAGCGGGGGSSSPPVLSITGRSLDGLSISLSQQNTSITLGEGNVYTVSVANDGTAPEVYDLTRDAAGVTPAYFNVVNASGDVTFQNPQGGAAIHSVELQPGQIVTRTVQVPASSLRRRGTYRVTAAFSNGSVQGDGGPDVLGPLFVTVR